MNHYHQILLTGTLWIASTINVNAQNSWSRVYDNLGVYSSPRVADFNGDGVGDIVVGLGRLEFMATDTAVAAFDGRNGDMLWHTPARDQIFGSALITKVNDDLVPDVIIGGRSAELMAIDGSNGQIIWEYFAAGDSVDATESGLFNFYNPQLIPDQDGDDQQDILIANGGDVRALPGDPHRPAGKLMIINAHGKLLAEAPMPDGKETYMSPVTGQIHPQGAWEIIFGTGGETLNGSLYRASLSSLREGKLNAHLLVSSSMAKGFIAPPVLVDLDHDQVKDIVVNAVEGVMIAINGADNTIMWRVQVPNTECYASLGVGYFNGDSIPDLFSTYAQGIWPNLGDARQLTVSGKDGSIIFKDSLGIVQTASPVIYDMNNDGTDDALLSVNYYLMQDTTRVYHNIMVGYDFKNSRLQGLTSHVPGVNLGSTPWIGDLDNDGYLDLVFFNLTETSDIYAMNGFRVTRLSTKIVLHKPVNWGAYMGSNYRGIFDPEGSIKE